MIPDEFIAKWRASELKERSASQSHFIDLCRLLGEPTPTDADPTGARYCFGRGARKDTGGDGGADIRSVFPQTARGLSNLGLSSGEYVLSVQGYRQPNSACMVSVPVRYASPGSWSVVDMEP